MYTWYGLLSILRLGYLRPNMLKLTKHLLVKQYAKVMAPHYGINH